MSWVKCLTVCLLMSNRLCWSICQFLHSFSSVINYVIILSIVSVAFIVSVYHYLHCQYPPCFSSPLYSFSSKSHLSLSSLLKFYPLNSFLLFICFPICLSSPPCYQRHYHYRHGSGWYLSFPQSCSESLLWAYSLMHFEEPNTTPNHNISAALWKLSVDPNGISTAAWCGE